MANSENNQSKIIRESSDPIDDDLEELDSDEDSFIGFNLYDLADEVIRETPELSEKYSGISRDYASDEDDDYEDDDSTEIYDFPPRNPIHTVVLTEVVEDYVCLETSIVANKKHLEAV